MQFGYTPISQVGDFRKWLFCHKIIRHRWNGPYSIYRISFWRILGIEFEWEFEGKEHDR